MPSEEQNQMVPAPAPKPRGVIASTAQAYAIVGGPATGKTEALIQHVGQLLADGADPLQILMFAATPDAVVALRNRLCAAYPSAQAVRITTPRQWCLEELDTPEAQAYTGRDARLLAPFEYDFLMEDLKVSGLRTKRLREMMKFFYKSMTEFADDAAGEWMISVEEESAFGLLKKCLGFTRGIIEPELANLTVRFLQANPMAQAKMLVSHVVVDDYQMLSRTSQMIANLIARESIAIAVDPQACVEVFESYPYAEGLDEFLEANPEATHTKLTESHACAASARAINLLRSDMAIVAEPVAVNDMVGNGQLYEIAAEDPAAEMEEVSSYLAQCLEGGIAPSDIVVASPHRAWSANLVKSLKSHGIDAEQSYSARIASGDIRTEDRCPAARMLTGLYLVANPHDAVAWRSWCGFGDWLTNSNILYNVREFGGQNGMALDAALTAAEHQMDVFSNAESVVDITRVIDAYKAGLALIDEAKDLSGRPLLEYLARTILGQGAQVPNVVLQLVNDMSDDSLVGDDAASMAKRAQMRLTVPTFEDNNCVHVTTYERMAGLSPKILLLCGFVNGFFPLRDYFDRAAMTHDKAERQHEYDTRLLMMVASKPTQELAVSHFGQTQLETAERLKLKLHRIRLKDKKRVALTEPSDFLARLKA